MTGEQERREELSGRLADVGKRIEAACRSAGRDPGEVTLIAVTKTFPASDVRLLYELGVRPDQVHLTDYDAGPRPHAPIVVGTQFTGTVAPNSSQRWFTFNWPAWQQVAWTVMPTTVDAANPQLTWSVAVQRTSGSFITYWITVTNSTNLPVNFEGRYEVLGRWK